MLSNFLFKVEKSQRSGSGVDDLYTSHLWYFNLLMFLTDHELPTTSIDNIEDLTQELDLEDDNNKGNQRYSYDRFIPRRAGINLEVLNYMLLEKSTSSNESESPTQEHKRFSNKAYIKWQRRMLRERIWASVSIPKKILNFSNSKQQSEKYNVTNQMWPVHARSKPLLGSPTIVLDMPSLEGNIYDNCTDWGNSGYLASVFGGEVFLWHPKNHNPECISNIERYVNKCISWNMHKPTFAMAMNEKIVSIYDCVEKKVVKEFTCQCEFACTVTAMRWTKRNTLITGCNHGNLMVFNSYFKLINQIYKAHGGIIIHISLSCNNTYLATTGDDNHVRIWRWPNLKEHFQITYETPVKGVAWHPWKPSYLAVGGGYGNGSLTLWNATNYTRLGYRAPSDNGAISVDSLTWNPLTGELVVSYWLEKNGIELNSIVVLSNLTTEVDAIEWHNGRVLYLLWGNDGATLATAGADENLCMWEFLGNFCNVKKFKNMRQTRKMVNDIFVTSKIFHQLIR
ncbi:hypothetical protein RN001_012445 [Aquatica leii]|uniref:Uncharacterized protein n=1 Tax=Aquatica leii TaxID=1421715 RepID=A0AAN7P5G5_9COLE|nr:hypothetical protein RN001_012445 [Aquatica leii]